MLSNANLFAQMAYRAPAAFGRNGHTDILPPHDQKLIPDNPISRG